MQIQACVSDPHFYPHDHLPAIWHLSQSTRSAPSTQGDCDCDCDCACPVDSFPAGKTERSPTLFPTSVYHRPNSIFIQELGVNRRLVSHPLSQGVIAVINLPAQTILSQFEKPCSLQEVVARLPQVRPETILSTLTKFKDLGLIQGEEATDDPAFQESETLSVWLHITNACNLLCPYCYIKKSRDTMDDEVAHRSIDAVFRSAMANRLRRVKLKYAGGEATLAFNQVLATHDYAAVVARRNDLELEACILSNGILMTHAMIDALLTRNIRVMISLDGLGKYQDEQRPSVSGRGSFDRVIPTIERLLARGVAPIISVTVSNRNLVGLVALIRFILAYDLPFNINFYREHQGSQDIADLRLDESRMIETLADVFAEIERNLPRRSLLGCLGDKANLNTLHRHTCGVGRNYLVIDHNGQVAKCQMDIVHSITTIDAPDPLTVVREDRLQVQNLPVEVKEGCRACEWRYWCAGGCPWLTFRATGRYDVKSPNCNIYKAIYPQLLRLEGLRLLAHTQPWAPYG